ncbi:hypothetical protein HS088_TW11G00688 [Tripterygium wilfordii]|uniref:Small VCP/p97-interacting protein n=1 Tax=Tripterygium wilfordii TaxID=458696 RepID=A0A7J7D2N8_TRIWF|nr:hypothetical protein HS088_TW11G00688 [Tripterygium wilfordii]
MGCFACFDGGTKQQREEERLASAEARAKAAEAAQRRQEQFEKSAAGRAAKAQIQANAKKSANSDKGEPVLKVFFPIMLICKCLILLVTNELMFCHT